MLIKDILNRFIISQHTKSTCQNVETFDSVELVSTYTCPVLCSKLDFIKYWQEICVLLNDDTFEINLYITPNDAIDGSADIVRILRQDTSINQLETFFDEVSDLFIDLDESNYLKVALFIHKNDSNKINIYFIKLFLDYIKALDFKVLITLINASLNNGNIYFIVHEDIIFTCKQGLFFIPIKDSLTSDYNKVLIPEFIAKNFSLHCYCPSFKFIVTPTCFDINILSPGYDIYNDYFKHLRNLISLLYISNYSNIESQNISLKINGYKMIEENLISNEIVDNDCFYEIFSWIYQDANIGARLEIARNLISFDFISSLKDINSATVNSIHSNYMIYLKENAEQYITLKTSISEHLINYSIRSQEIADKLANEFTRALVANLSFVFTYFITHMLSDTTSSFEFDDKISILYIVFLFGSLIYMFISLHMLKLNIQRYKDLFLNQKKSYSKIIAKDDLNDTFDESLLAYDINYINHRKKIYVSLWLLFIIISFILLYQLSPWFATTIKNLVILISASFNFLLNSIS